MSTALITLIGIFITAFGGLLGTYLVARANAEIARANAEATRATAAASVEVARINAAATVMVARINAPPGAPSGSP